MYFEQFPLFLLAYRQENRITSFVWLECICWCSCCCLFVVFGGAAFSSCGHQESASHFDYVHRSMRFHSYCHKCTLVAWMYTYNAYSGIEVMSLSNLCACLSSWRRTYLITLLNNFVVLIVAAVVIVVVFEQNLIFHKIHWNHRWICGISLRLCRFIYQCSWCGVDRFYFHR